MNLKSFGFSSDASGDAYLRAQPPTAQERDIARVNSALVPILVVGMFALVCRGWNTGGTCSMLIWAVASLSAGGTLGFLFGIPRSSSAPARKSTSENDPATSADARLQLATSPAASVGHSDSRPNTNLEEISDWITKIIVGLALVNLKDIQAQVQMISSNAAASFSARPTAADQSFATALLVAFAVLGFFAGYLYTRLFLQGAFARSDADLKRDWVDVLRQETSKQLKDPPADDVKATLPTTEQIQSAERVSRAAPSGSPEIVLAPVRALALEYEGLRQSMPAGAERTRAMGEVVRKMFPLALTMVPYLGYLTKSDSAGMRLAAVVALKFKFDIAYLDWLADRVRTETAFVAFHASGALLAGARSLGADEKQALKAKAAEVQKDLADRGLSDSGVQRVLEQIVAT